MSQSTVTDHVDAWMDPVAARLTDLRALTQAHVLVVDANSRLIDFALREQPPEQLVRVVLSKDARGLLNAVTNRRLEGRAPNGPIVSGSLGDSSVLQVPLTLGSSAGTFLVLGCGATQDIACIVSQTTQLSALLTRRTVATDDVATALLRGEPKTPQPWIGLPLHCALLRTPATAAEQRIAAIRADTCSTHISATVVPDGIALVLAAPMKELDALLGNAIGLMTAILGAAPTGAVSGPATESNGLPRLFDEARQAAPLALPGTVIRSSTVTATLDVRRAVHAVYSAERLPDPLQPLHDYDAARGSDLAGSLLSWLEGGGDTQAAAQRLSLHANTLRYRLRRAVDLLGVDLDDVDARLSVHLRLRGWAEARSTSKQGLVRGLPG